ncbi:hypothetical protein FHR72_001756 [Mycolicibacterium iranicum]|uniref:Uncharacterized protein n=1 Tax=Mycolicibacterium iranicum TaxID=912594 RepID=A0A839Q1R6_MYCIR|nr:hypothetical protein [Mycolicibacterium iranicum]MBB2990288.1 hypothetical protein [Mycolicibacterium iranicum]
MSVIRRSRSLARRGLKIQRRVAIAQVLFWPALVSTGVAVGVAAAVLRRKQPGPTSGGV